MAFLCLAPNGSVYQLKALEKDFVNDGNRGVTGFVQPTRSDVFEDQFCDFGYVMHDKPLKETGL